MSPRLHGGIALPDDVRGPAYDRGAHGYGIVHLGVGAFHRAHQAVYTDDAITAEGGDWRIQGVSLRRPDAGEALNPQDGLYTLIQRGGTEPARVIGALGPMLGPLDAPGKAERTLAALTDPSTRIVTLSVTEKGYGLDAAREGPDADDPAIARDMAALRERRWGTTRTVPGLLAATLLVRCEAEAPPVAIVCCDNLPKNGRLVRALVVGMVPPSERGFVAEQAFPDTMVDRITPAPDDATRRDASRALGGLIDLAAVETEPFSQWVIEDDFRGVPRPAWEAGGAMLAPDVAPFEAMKLSMLNGAHSLIAYRGQLAGLETVREVVAVPEHRAAARALMAAAARTLAPVPGMDLDRYADALIERFGNPAIAHRTRQIAMDGTQKLPQRILAPARRAIERGDDPVPFARVVRDWMAFVRREAQGDGPDDPRAGRLRDAAHSREPIVSLADVLGIDPVLRANAAFMDEVRR